MVGWEIRSSAWRCHCLQLMPLLLLVFSSLCLLSYLCFRFAHVFSMVRAVWRNMLPLLSVCVSVCVCVCQCVLPVSGTVPYENLGHLMRFTCSLLPSLPLPLLSVYVSLCCSRLFDAPLKITHYLPQRTQVERRRQRQRQQQQQLQSNDTSASKTAHSSRQEGVAAGGQQQHKASEEARGGVERGTKHCERRGKCRTTT